MNTQTLKRTLKALKTGVTAIVLIAATAFAVSAQENNNDKYPVKRKHYKDDYGHTLNMGVGFSYYGYQGYSVPFFGLNYEIGVARNFTLAPAIGISSYRSYDYYSYGGGHYYYHETVVPIGLKATYYFDEILNAGPNWDFYLAASLGFNIHRVAWDDGYYGDKNVYRGASAMYLDGHIGAEYHINHSLGIFLDASTGISTIGLAVHHL